MASLTDTTTAPDPSSASIDTSSSVQADLENALFGGPISQTAPDLLDLSDSSQMGGMDYSFYTDPASQGYSPGGYTDLSTGDPYQDFYNQLPSFDLSQFDTSTSGAYMNPDGSISMS